MLEVCTLAACSSARVAFVALDDATVVGYWRGHLTGVRIAMPWLNLLRDRRGGVASELLWFVARWFVNRQETQV